MDETPIQVHMEAIVRRLVGVERLAFHAVFTPPHTRGRLLGLFLAILELIKAGSIVVEQAEVFGELWLSPAPQVVK
jgi:segregation and condensation protein A